jgi:hypothetical protein
VDNYHASSLKSAGSEVRQTLSLLSLHAMVAPDRRSGVCRVVYRVGKGSLSTCLCMFPDSVFADLRRRFSVDAYVWSVELQLPPSKLTPTSSRCGFCPDAINVDLVVSVTSPCDVGSDVSDAMSWLTAGVADVGTALTSGLFVVTYDLPERGESLKSFVDRVRSLQEQSVKDTVAHFGVHCCALVTRYSSYCRRRVLPTVGSH